MSCPRCGFTNPDGFAFCGQCAAPLRAACGTCGFSNPLGLVYCGQCGTSLAAATTGLTPADIEHLRRYLPVTLVDALQFDRLAPPAGLLDRCQARLSQLLALTSHHLPPYLVERLVRRQPTPGAGGGEFMTGTLLFADISGFTPMAEKLSRLGREGAEELTLIVSRYFAVMLDVLRAHGGQLIQFGGDALLALFREPPAGSAARAAQAALQMQAGMPAFAATPTSQGQFSLRMKVGLHTGRFFAAELGDAQGMLPALIGAAVNATAAAEAAASAGQVVLDHVTAAALEGTGEFSSGPAGHQVLERLTGPWSAPAPTPAGADLLPPLAAPTPAGLLELARRLDTFTPYLPAGLLTRLSHSSHGPRLEGEHRLVGVLFANVRGLGIIADTLGPGREPEIGAVLNRYFTTMAGAIQRFGGTVNKLDLAVQGDKLLAFFGAPAAHEDDAERAVRAAWAMQTALPRLALPPGQPALTQRLGLSYGYAFAGYLGNDWRHEYTVMGDEVNLAARLMAAAAEGSLTVSSHVMRQARGAFHFTPRGEVTLKGKSQPFRLFTVDGPRAVPDPVRGLAGLHAPLIGRAAEQSSLAAAAEQVRAGRGQLVLLEGEAGAGKTRLAAELRPLLPEARWVAGQCLSYTETVSYTPFQAPVRHLLGLQPEDGDLVSLVKLRAALAECLPAADGPVHLPYLAHFLGLPLEAAWQERVRYLDAEALQRRTFLALSEVVAARSRTAGHPLALQLDDLHWMDQASLALLEFLMPLVDRGPLLLVLLYRPERDKGCWRIRERAAREFPHCTRTITLDRLSPADTEQLLQHLIPLTDWPGPLRDRLLQHAEGNPLYIEELLRILIDRQILARAADGTWQMAGNWHAFHVPDTLQQVLMTRLDQLDEPPRRTAQVAAVVGRDFGFEVLEHVDREPGEALPAHLGRLQQRDFILETSRTPELSYAFRHGLMQTVCYESLPVRTRREYHRRIVAHLDQRYPPGSREAEAIEPLIAQHAYAGQDWPRALPALLAVAQRAQRLSATAEALSAYTRAGHCADQLPANATESERLALHLGLGITQTIRGEYAAARAHLADALKLAEQRGAVEAELRACHWLARGHELAGDYAAAEVWLARGLTRAPRPAVDEEAQLRLIAGLILCRQARLTEAEQQAQAGRVIAEALGELTILARVHMLLAVITLQRGENHASANEASLALELYTRAGDLAGQASAHNQRANAAFNLGGWSEADAAYRRARAVFEQIGDVYNRAFVENNLGEIALNQGRWEEAEGFYRAALRGMESLGSSAYALGALHNNLGAVLIRRGAVEAARHELAQSQRLFEQAAARDFLPELHRHRAELAIAQGDWPAAQAAAQQSLEMACELNMQAEAAITQRVLGEIHLAQAALPQAEAYLQRSLAALTALGDAYQAACSRLALAWLAAARPAPAEASAELDLCEPVLMRMSAAPQLAAVQALRTKLDRGRP
ncbi:MAG: AAA family ATPase [Anaerolineales bacterium]|nr:AAA family ATPase [Anaerolineales bacterium]